MTSTYLWFDYWSDGPDDRLRSLGRPIMYWSKVVRPDAYEDAAGYVDSERRQWVIETLRNSPQLEEWRGSTSCRICRQTLGSRDLGAHGFIWPEMAEHYILEHGVWHPDLDALYDVAHQTGNEL